MDKSIKSSVKITGKGKGDSEFGEGVMSEINSLREELSAIRQLMEREHSLDNAMREYNYLPSNKNNLIRWGFMGAWGSGGSNHAHSVITTPMDEYFDNPPARDENVAAFAAAFTNPSTIKICKYLFRGRGRSREEIKEECKLSDAELDDAVKPLLEWRFVEWENERLENIDHGLHYVVTLVGMAKIAVAKRDNLL